MYKQILHTPEGVRDIYNGECRRKQYIQETLHQVLTGYGYEDIPVSYTHLRAPRD